MTDTEINLAIHTHLGLPLTVTRWRFDFTANGKTESCQPYATREDAEATAKWMEHQEWGGCSSVVESGPVEPYERPVRPKDYCNDRDAMADAISKMKVHDTGGFTEELAPHWLDSEIQGDELIEFTLLILTKPCRDLAAAFVKAIGKWKSTETPTEKYV